MGSPFQRQSSGANLVKGSEFGRESRNVGRIICPGHIAWLPKRVASEQPGRSAGVSHRCVDPTPFESSSWNDVDGMSLERVYDSRFRVLQSCPHHLRGRFRKACRQVLESRHEDVQAGDDVKETRSWKMFCLLPFMLLRRPAGEGRVGKAELCRRFDLFSEGQWKRLYEEGFRDIRSENTRRPVFKLSSNEQRGQAALQKVRLGEVSRARQCLVGAALAPGTEETLAEMQNKRPQVVFRELTEEVLNYELDVRVTLDRKLLLQSLRTAPRGSSPGPGGFTYEHARVLLDDSDTFDLLVEALNSLARGAVPVDVSAALMRARLTALSKPDGGVRGIATGTTLRRLVGRTLAKQFAKAFEAECSPFQYALSARAGTDCVGHMIRAITDSDPTATVLKVDGIGAYDHVSRAAMLQRLVNMEEGRAILPFVRLSYGSPSSYQWFNEDGECRTVTQVEGGEQGDPLMPLLFSIGIQGALEEVSTQLLAGEQLCAFLDDVYVVCQPGRVRFMYNILADALGRVVGIQLHATSMTWARKCGSHEASPCWAPRSVVSSTSARR